MRQLRLVQLAQCTAGDSPAQVLAGSQHQVVTTAAGEQFGFHGFQRIEVIDHHADTGLLFERSQGVRGQVFAPDIQVDLLRRSAGLRVCAGGKGHGQQTGAA